MAWVEAAIVLYLRVYLNRIQPYQVDPLPSGLGLARAELVREAATLVMLGCVGWLAGSDRRARFGYAMLVFGVWDILYYVFLVPLSGWPKSLLDWDILFLIPLPWWGPVLAPASIAALMVFTGTVIALTPLWPRFASWLVSLAGACLALYTFMADALHALGDGPLAVRNVLPASYNWPLFALALALLALPLADMFWRGWIAPEYRSRTGNRQGSAPSARRIAGPAQ
jgi:hypothetical protein